MPTGAKSMRIVLDTNVIVSAYIWGGIPESVIRIIFNQQLLRLEHYKDTKIVSPTALVKMLS